MSLFVVATPIGNPKDITLRAIEILTEADLVIGEERAEVSKLLKGLSLSGKETALLNEHSRPDDVADLVKKCRTKKVALVSDCGTPGFCDPGADLVRECRKAGIEVTTLPGASSLMALLSLTGWKFRGFVFAGFLPAEREERQRALAGLKSEKRAVVVMDTPYRLAKTIGELAKVMPQRRAVLGLNLTQADERVLESTLTNLASKVEGQKAEFVLWLAAQE